MSVPFSINTARLTLRQFAAEDWGSLQEHYSDLECKKFTFGPALTEGESWRATANMVGHWQLRGFGPYAVVDRAADVIVGTVWTLVSKRLARTGDQWALVLRAWGKGFASRRHGLFSRSPLAIRTRHRTASSGGTTWRRSRLPKLSPRRSKTRFPSAAIRIASIVIRERRLNDA